MKPTARPLSCAIRIGPAVIELLCPSRAWLKLLQSRYHRFIVSGTRARYAVTIGTLKGGKRRPLSVTGDNLRWVIERYDFRSISAEDLSKTTLAAQPDRYAFDSWLRIFCSLVLLRHDSFLLHAAGWHYGKSCLVFPGRSGRGKSTITRIFGKKEALSDELVCAGMKGNRAYAASTPFWGELRKGSTVTSGALRGIFFIEHGKENAALPLMKKASIGTLLSTVLFFSRDTAHLGSLLRIADALLSRVPAFRFAFTRSLKREQLVNMLNEALHHGKV